jgi:LmbE family N-acetylglucosaminyl deacetylase
MAKASAAGLRTIVVYGTKGDAGETNADLGGQTLGERRVDEATAACAALQVDRIEWLPYADSGMADTEENENPDAFSNADPDAVAAELASLLADEQVVAVVGYDRNGTYGHPDHKQVHHVAHRAVETLNADWVFDATYNREYLSGLPDADGSLDPNFAAGEAELTHFVTGPRWVEAKINAIKHHVSQIPEDWDDDNPDVEGFTARFGTEWFIAHSPTEQTDLGVLDPILEPKAAWTGQQS